MAIVVYLLYRFIVNFLVPVMRATRQVRAQFKNMQDQANGGNGAHGDAASGSASHGGASGGTGKSFDWDRTAAVVREVQEATGGRVIVAGGLNAENVGAAIAAFRPWGVDVASGVERAPGKKDPERLRAFVTAARAAGLPEG